MDTNDTGAAPQLSSPAGGRIAAATLRQLLDRAFPRPVPPPRALDIECAVLTSVTGA